MVKECTAGPAGWCYTEPMNSPLADTAVTPRTTISFRHMDRSPALAARIESEIAKLRRYAPGLEHCDVVFEELHRHQRLGHPYHVHLVLRLPGAEVVVTHEPSARRGVAVADRPERPAQPGEVEAVHRDAYVAVRDAFDAARRQLADTIRRMRDRGRVPGAMRSPRNVEPVWVDAGGAWAS